MRKLVSVTMLVAQYNIQEVILGLWSDNFGR